ncbi:MAG TPA: hypothetical protein VN982_11710 [Candidatus Dormibacteraeota bacterium]|nr:hypothetical protein [Candidatus Dormibacteraeota bacterium]
MKRISVFAVFLFFSSSARAQQTTSEPPVQVAAAASSEDARMKALEEQVSTLASQVSLLRAELQQLRGANANTPQTAANAEPGAAVTPPVPAAVSAPAAGPQTFGGASGNAKLLNPDISLIGDFIGTVGHNDISPGKSLEMHESELGIQAIIDPYARADAFISFGETGVNVEEAYVTFTSLPAGLLLKVGKKRADFGKVNTIHNHALQFIDRPLVTNNLVGGEDGINDAGLFLSRFLPAPKNWFLEGSAEVLRGDSGDVFQANRREDVSVVGHLRAYRDLSESTNLDLGLSYARGHNTLGSDFLTNLYSADATLRWKPLRRAIYNSFLFRTELVWSARDQFAVLQPTLFRTEHTFGLYSVAEYRVNRRWIVAGRFDRSGHARDARLTDTGFSGIITYWPSEFSQIRGQYRFGRLATAPNTFSNANELLFQFLFVMGAHGAHPF